VNYCHCEIISASYPWINTMPIQKFIIILKLLKWWWCRRIVMIQ
jgi:hypothetical protein